MKLEIIFTDEATEILLLIARQIENKWSQKQADEFLRSVYRTLDLMSSQPYMYKSSLVRNNKKRAGHETMFSILRDTRNPNNYSLFLG